MGAILFSGLMVASCDSDDGGGSGPSEPEQQGTFTGTVTNATDGEMNEWSSSSLTAEFDTFNTELSINAVNPAGAEINITIGGDIDVDNQTPKPFSGLSSSNISTYTTPSGTEFTTDRNDFGESSGTIVYTSYNDSTNLLEGMGSLKWYATSDTTEDDLNYVMQDIAFELYPELVGPSFGSASISATIDGEAFATSFTGSSSSGGVISINSGSTSGESLSIVIQSGATEGETSLGQGSSVTLSYSDSEQNTYISSSGTVNITSLDLDEGIAEGTFNFTGSATSGSGSVDVTNGTFSVE
jgi:hypothetical protein